MSKIIGIDLGSVRSSMAVYEGNRVVLIPNAEGSLSTPSVVLRKANGGWLAGSSAEEYAAHHPESTLRSVMETADAKALPALQPLSVFLTKLRLDAEEYLNDTVDSAVITVPGWYDLKQRGIIREVATIAGFREVRPVSAGTAAAVAHSAGLKEEQKILLVDVGASGLSVTAVSADDAVCEVLVSGGEARLGGNAFDECIVRYTAEELRKANGIAPEATPAGRSQLKEAAEKAKNELTETANVRLTLPNTGSLSAPPFELSLSRNKFEELTRPLVQRIFQCVKSAMQDAEFIPSPCNRVILTGCAGRIPAVQAAVRQAAGTAAFIAVGTDNSVVKGAAMQAGIMAGKLKELLVMDALNLSLGLKTQGDVFTRLIEKGTTIPVLQSRIFTTTADKQETVGVCVVQGESGKAGENREILKFSVNEIAPAPKGEPRIEVTFSVTRDWELTVEATDKENGTKKQITLLPTVSDSEMQRCKNETARFAAEYAGKSHQAPPEKAPAKNAPVASHSEPLTEEMKAFVKELFPVLDNLERAIGAASGAAETPFRKGVELTYRQLSGILEKHGITAIDRKGQPFDPNLENAVMQGSPNEGRPGTVCEVLLKGYRTEGEILRYAMVKAVPE